MAALRDEMRHEILAEGFKGVIVADSPDEDGAGSCSPSGQTVLRYGFTANGQGMVLAAISDRRVAGKSYDPSASADIEDLDPRDCARQGIARAQIGHY
jgi:hypothetical protein